MSLFNKDIFNPLIPVCEKHNFKGNFCFQCNDEKIESMLLYIESLEKENLRLKIEISKQPIYINTHLGDINM